MPRWPSLTLLHESHVLWSGRQICTPLPPCEAKSMVCSLALLAVFCWSQSFHFVCLSCDCRNYWFAVICSVRLFVRTFSAICVFNVREKKELLPVLLLKAKLCCLCCIFYTCMYGKILDCCFQNSNSISVITISSLEIMLVEGQYIIIATNMAATHLFLFKWGFLYSWRRLYFSVTNSNIRLHALPSSCFESCYNNERF